LLPSSAHAQQYPSKPIRMIVPWLAGGSTDVLGRALGVELAKEFGQPVIIDNRAGAAGKVGTAIAARSPADGYTIYLGTIANFGVAAAWEKSLQYDPVKDFAPVAYVADSPAMLAVSSSLPIHNLKELRDYARTSGRQMTYASAGEGSGYHLMGELFNQTAGVKINHVPYRGVAPALQDVIAGHIPMAYLSISNVLGVADQKSVKILAVLEPKRFAARPQIPSMSEVLPGFRKPSSWFGMFAPPGLPPAITARLNAETMKALNAPDVLPKLNDNGLSVIGGTPDDFKMLIEDGIARYGAIIKAAGIQPE